MMIDSDIREKVRQRAGFACEFCGITEADCGGYLTVDHFRPRSKGGDDSLDNLLYCCIHCNQYKLDYWPNHPGDPVLWNPRKESASFHFLELDDGNLIALTAIGAFTLRRLRLNRPPLIAYRLRKNKSDRYNRLLSQYRDLTKSLEKLLYQQAELIDEQQRLLKQQSRLLQILLQGNK
jgi:hypothetical protein